MREYHAAAQLRILIELAERGRQPVQHVGVERVHLGGAVDPQEQQVAALLVRDLRLVVHKTLYNAAVDACHRPHRRPSDLRACLQLLCEAAK
jgi:hypothetical protein